MPLIPDPCFIETIRRASGSKRVLVHVTNADAVAKELKIENVSKPEWIDVEGAMIGNTLKFKKGGKLPLVINLNTDHRFFPTEAATREEIRFEFATGDPLVIFIYLQSIISDVPVFRGTFAMDFGTTNTCFAWKKRVGDDVAIKDMLAPPEVSREIPTLVRFKDISNRDYPGIDIGNHARDYIAHNSGKSFTYAISIKRMLGQDKELVILDERSGLEANRFQKYKPEDVAGFIIREFLRDAEQRIGERIDQVVATFPILYNRRKQEALRAAFRKAFESLNRPWSDDSLILRLDETNAAAFNYIYGQLLDEFRRFSVQKKQHRILSYDFGGGTIDVSLVDVDLSRDNAGRIKVHTEMRGVTGDRYLGGDTVTLAVLKILKYKLAVQAAKRRLAILREQQQAREAEAAAQTAAANPWALPSAEAKPAAQKTDDPWAEVEAEAAAATAPAPVEEELDDPETADIENHTPESQLEPALELLNERGDVLDLACLWGKSLKITVTKMVEQGKLKLQPFEITELAQKLEEAIDLVLPTRWAALERQGDLITKETARKLFYELWLPAEVMKIKAVTDETRQARLTEPLNKIAKYTGVRPDDLMGVTLSEAEINAAVDESLRRSIGKAAFLARSVETPNTQATGLSFGIGQLGNPDERPLTILLAGNGSRLPIVRTLVEEIFQVDSSRVVMDPNGVKATVAQGACEEHILRRDFGKEGGLIEYDAGDFTTRLPFSIGLFHKELSLIGFAGGFAPVMTRSTPVDTMVLITEALQVVHRKATELTLFSYYHDHELGRDPGAPGAVLGVEPVNLGWFDLTKPEATTWEQPFTEDLQAQVEALGDRFGLVLYLDANRDLTLIDPKSKKFYKMKAAAELCPDVENPFSGVH